MSGETWNKDEIRKLAQASGKPLEVRCAEMFLRAAWQVRLGTFYLDAVSEKLRELDFLAERTFSVSTTNHNQDRINWKLHIRILGSCKGLPADSVPITYSVSSSSTSVEEPRLLCYECGIHGRKIADQFRVRSAKRLLFLIGMDPPAQQAIGFDVFSRDKSGKPTRAKDQDRAIYEGLDSALKSAFFWFQEDRREANRQFGTEKPGYIALSIPLLVSLRPFWDIPIDGGVVGEPKPRSSAFHVSLFPSPDKERSPEPIMSILWEASNLDALMQPLKHLMADFVGIVQQNPIGET